MHRLGAYAFTLGVILVAVVGDFALMANIAAVPFVLFGIAILLVTWFAGLGPGLVALVLCTLIGNLVIREPRWHLVVDIDSLVVAGFSLLVGGIVVGIVASHRAAVLRERREHERRLLLATVASTLDRSLDYEATLATVAGQMVPRLGDWCAVHMREGGELRCIAVAVSNTQDVELTHELARSSSIDLTADRGMVQVLRTGRPAMVAHVDEESIEGFPIDADLRAQLLKLGARSCMVVPIRRDDGETMGVLSLAMMGSDRYYAPEDLELAMALASRAALAIERARLYREARTERERAEQASHAKDQFLAMLGHELRNPLAPIRTALELMAMRDTEAFKKERTVISRQLEQLMSLVDDLLDVSRIARGKIELHRAPVTVHEVVTKGVELASPLIESRRHQLRVDVDPDLLVDGDPARLAQVVSNLAMNAAKYTEPGGRIEIAGKRVRGQAKITVRDSGIGISEDMMPHLFDMFVQAPQSLDRSHGGLGLGLSIVRSLVELHGGSVRAHSGGRGTGSTFEVTLPALEGPPVVSRPRAVENPTARRVLVVDDNPDALWLLSDALELRGYTISRAHDGPSALAVAAKARPEVALLDIGLPVMDGYELARRLREKDASMKLVAVTGYDQPGDFERTRRAGFSAHLVKPISLERVQQTIDQLVEVPSVTPAPARGATVSAS